MDAFDHDMTQHDRIAELERKNGWMVMKLNAEHLVRQNVERENAELRELVRRMARALRVGGEWCDRDCGAEFGCDLTDCPIEREMRELGVVE